MNLDTFMYTIAAREMRYQRCFYVISPRPDPSLGIAAPRWTKMGIASTDLFNRLKSYRTYWPSGINVHMIACIAQREDSDVCEIKKLEKQVITLPWLQSQRIRASESLVDITRVQRESIAKMLLNNKNVLRAWMPANTLVRRTWEFIEGRSALNIAGHVDTNPLDIEVPSPHGQVHGQRNKPTTVAANEII